MVELSLSTYQHQQFGEIRTLINDDGEPWFVAKEVAEALGYSNTRDAISKHCRCVAKHDLPHPQSHGKTIEVNIIPESDLYRLILRSKLPQAEAFQDWVTSEVLPSIRKYGVYRKESREELTEASFIERNGSFWLEMKLIAEELDHIGIPKDSENVELTFDEHKEFLQNYYAKIDGKECLRDHGIIYLLLMISFEVLIKKEEIMKLCARIEGMVESLKGKDTKHIRISAVKAYQEVVSRISSSGKDINFIAGLIRYKKKELTSSEIAVLTGQKADDVAVYLEELETSGIMDMADFFVDTLPAQISLPPAPAVKQPEPAAPQSGVSQKLIRAIGANEAVVLNQLETMIARSKRDSIQITYSEWLRRFPFRSHSSLKRVIQKLEGMGIIISKKGFNNFQWAKEYRIDREVLKRYAGE